MKRPSKTAIAAAAIVGTLAAIGIVIQPQAVEVSVTIYEDANGGGDHFVTTAIGATNVHQANLSLITTGLNNGCNRGINQSSTWNDCVSSARVTSLPASTKLIFYRDINYGFTQSCYDVDGSHLIDLSPTGDTVSSFRIISGNCP